MRDMIDTTVRHREIENGVFQSAQFLLYFKQGELRYYCLVDTRIKMCTMLHKNNRESPTWVQWVSEITSRANCLSTRSSRTGRSSLAVE